MRGTCGRAATMKAGASSRDRSTWPSRRMFGHQYSHVWIDFRGIRDEYMREPRHRLFREQPPRDLRAARICDRKSDEVEGLRRGCLGSDRQRRSAAHQQDYEGEQREFRHYSARGAGLRDHFDDGTIAPTAAIASLPFAPEIVIPATQAMFERYGEYIYSSYGFLDSFNPSFTYDIPLKTGRMVPGKGWVASDYIGIDQGPILAMIANYRNGFVWERHEAQQAHPPRAGTCRLHWRVAGRQRRVETVRGRPMPTPRRRAPWAWRNRGRRPRTTLKSRRRDRSRCSRLAHGFGVRELVSTSFPRRREPSRL